MYISRLLPWALAAIASATRISAAAISNDTCTNITASNFPGLDVLSISGTVRQNFTVAPFMTLSPNAVTNLNFCDVELVVTHPGANDSIKIIVWLPMSGWNGRFQGTGGGGFATDIVGVDGSYPGLALAVKSGYAAAATDGGHIPDQFDPSTWALTSDGQVNLNLLINFASRSLHDMAVVGKAITANFYGTPANYSYWNSCSTGGRQGLMIAQRYPYDYHGITANAPAVYYNTISVAGHWPHIVMQEMKTVPTQCEFMAFYNASVAVCDPQDGVTDGIVNNPNQCFFQANQLVGSTVNCDGKNVTITQDVANVVQAIWNGPHTQTGNPLWWGISKGTLFAFAANTTTLSNGTTVDIPSGLTSNWILWFLEKNPHFDISSITYQDFENLYNQTKLEYDTIFATDDPDLSPFNAAGGKMITWHGLSDEIISPNGTRKYFESVEDIMGGNTTVDSFYRLFFAPGVDHCGGGIGAAPVDPLAALVNWVENGVAPDTLPAAILNTDGTKKNRNLCRYPYIAKYDGKGDPNSANSFSCVTP